MSDSDDTIEYEPHFFGIVPDGLWRDPEIPDSTLRTYLALRSFAANTTGQCWPAIATIADRAHLTTPTVHKALKVLELKGWLVVTGRPNGSNRYLVRFRQPTKQPVDNPPAGADENISPNPEVLNLLTPAVKSFNSEVLNLLTLTRSRELDPKNKTQLVASDNPPVDNSRKRDLLWETLTDIFGDPATKSERGKYNSVHKKLREADVDHTELPELVAAYMTKYSKPNSPAPQPTAVTIAERVGELRHFIERGPIGSPNGTINDLVYQQRNAAVFARLEAEYGNTGGES